MPPPSPARTVGDRYRLAAPIGSGGMGTVWSAHDLLLDRDVAVKEVVPPAGLTDGQRAELVARTFREARAAARISSRAAVTVYDVFEDDGRPWIVMELVPARTLAQRVRDDGPLPADEVARIGLCVLDALDAAHAAGVLHRDVKPANVLVDGDRAVLTDFGIATLEGDPSLTATGTLVGSPAYLAPERCRGAVATPASDLWSLGATLYTAVEGRSPFHREGQLPTLTAVLTEEPHRPRRVGALEPVIAGLLRKDPVERLGAASVRPLLQRAAAAPAAPAPRPDAVGAAAVAEADRTRALSAVPAAGAGPAAAAAPPAASHAAGSDGASSDGTGSGRWRRVAAGVAAALLLAGAATGTALVVGEGDDDPAATSPPAATPSDDDVAPSGDTAAGRASTDPGDTTGDGGKAGAGAGPVADADSVAAPSPAPSVDPDSEQADGDEDGVDVPDGFTRVEDDSGFALAVPAGWERAVEDGVVYFRQPGGGGLMLVDQTDDPAEDPLADWREAAANADGRYQAYEEIRLEGVDYRGWQAADWEFTYAPDGAERRRVLNRNVLVSGDQAYALYWSTPVDRWDDLREDFDIVAASFEPAS